MRDRIFAGDFQRDIFGQLPPELTSLVALHLDINDIFNLRAVSKFWQEVLTSPATLRAAIELRTGKCPAFGTPIAELEATLQSRWRIEYGRPANSGASEYPQMIFHFPELVVYRKGIIVGYNGYHICVLDVRTGVRTDYTLENREEPERLETSGRLLAATTTRHCYVWDLQTTQSKSFRLPSANYQALLVKGSKVMLYYPSGQVVQFCFESQITRTINLEHPVIALSLHENGEFSIIEMKMAHDQFRRGRPILEEEWETYKLQVKRFSLQEDGFQCSLGQNFDISPFLAPMVNKIEFDSFHPFKTAQYCSDIKLNWCVLGNLDPGCETTTHLRFTLEDDDTVEAYWTVEPEDRFGHGDPVSQFVTENNIMYSHRYTTLVLASERSQILSTPPGTALFMFKKQKTLPYDGTEPTLPSLHHLSCDIWQGDDDFFVLALGSASTVCVASFKSDWKPVGELYEEQWERDL
ncbi:unnamed protein product [Penicillium salamii]|uniref:F-box domain-containing protein n=1 Tax=Penicillium salamii TaxID=1612424 RepID=A0A9W4JHV2_9EURO|nr:unnamed protein product [Penicillium salamii]CAG8122726.1 unnamed protein product [Penicillium salamii]CAG8132328.1 unnamed protein product [Penicillium salamii]CAG8157636.1 unnamed protein product [Penicillium salamii]CAG8187070.1 unnamed protein product [Penicillium salamii]